MQIDSDLLLVAVKKILRLFVLSLLFSNLDYIYRLYTTDRLAQQWTVLHYLVLFDVLLLHRLEVSSEVHGALVFGAQQGSHHLVCRHPHLPQSRLFELASQILHFQLQLVDLRQFNERRLGRSCASRRQRPRLSCVRLTSLLCLPTLYSQSYLSSSTISIFSWSCLHRACRP